ncbi:ABC transporter ATP-binding protein [Luethyella okanaganae]|uniref:ABC transporter ATP-binding protein n=1 Tax=Luethyella okanaganae TaxID=69372 RepID=A0ABW1VHQ3_9MICO
MTAVLAVENLGLRFGTSLPVIRGVSFAIEKGEVLGIVGESGSGKTLTARCILGLQPPSATVSGSIRLHGTELVGSSEKSHRLARAHDIGYVAQDARASLHPLLTVQTLITEHQRINLGIGMKPATQRAIELLDLMRIPDPVGALHKRPGEFSGGMRQRIMIAVALACDPSLLIADEPTTALDATVQATVIGLFDRIRRQLGIGVALISHDLGVISALSDKVIVMAQGVVVEHGSRRQVLSTPTHPYTRSLLEAVSRGRL